MVYRKGKNGRQSAIEKRVLSEFLNASYLTRWSMFFAPITGNLMRLSDSSSGFVEVFHDGQWWRVCDQGWDPDDALVACRQLGYRHPSKTMSPVLTAASPGRSIDARGDIGVLLNKMRCHGNETNLAFCPHSGLGPQVCATRNGHATVDCNGNMPRRSNEIGMYENLTIFWEAYVWCLV